MLVGAALDAGEGAGEHARSFCLVAVDGTTLSAPDEDAVTWRADVHESGRYPDTAMSVVIGDPIPCTAVAVNITQLRVNRFEGAKLLGPVGAAAMARVDQALRAVQDL
ncbi:hypothetical protein [Streptomyces alanosinicus]|uniref:Uncharacterized protein n=1 Tax=Streptomyces alanosinicus TaxID=68171 RepID=A0A918YS20_9ACTN|nr:hypothetical protein [Streptomyces alanosinicus]GHE13338.1 hypothetical protein GCM10010339_79960 [Streptomyces alanosinicus]